MRAARRWAGLWGPIAFAVASIAAAPRQPGYSHRGQPVSGLAARGTRLALVMVPGFVTLGLSGLVMQIDDPVISKLVRAPALGLLLSAVARCTTPDCPSPFRGEEV